MDANLKDLFLLGRLIEDAVDGAVVVGVSGPLTITIRPNFTLTLGKMAAKNFFFWRSFQL